MKARWPFIIVALLSGCAATQTSQVLLGAVRPSIQPDEVRIYLQDPGQPYQEIALITTDSQWDWKFSDRGHSDAVIARLKRAAAKLGANALLLGNFGEKHIGAVSGGTGSMTYSAGLGVKAGQALAVYIAPRTQPATPASTPTRPSVKRL